MEAIRQITPHLSALGVRTTVACLDPPDAPWLPDFPAPVEAFGPVQGVYGYRRGLMPRLEAMIRASDAVIIDGIWQYHAFAAWRAMRSVPGIPYFVYTHGMLDPWFKRTYPLKHLKKWAYWPWADYRVLRDAKRVIFTTEQERLLARQSFWLYRAREQVLSFGTSPPPGETQRQRQAFLERFPELQGRRFLLYLSRIHPKKGTDLLIEAFAQIACLDPELYLVIAGPDQLGWQAELESRADRLGIASRLAWTGMLSGDLKWGAFRSAEAFCLPSHQENFGIVVAEALACGVPVLIGEPVNIAEDVRQAGAGLVHVDTTAGTAQAMRQWIALPAGERACMAEAAQALFSRCFEISRTAQELADLLAGHGAPPVTEQLA
jgi:glycosyltransferase involved in cell wall biosynthesis